MDDIVINEEFYCRLFSDEKIPCPKCHIGYLMTKAKKGMKVHCITCSECDYMMNIDYVDEAIEKLFE